MTDETLPSYDAVPYRGGAHVGCDPRRLAAVAALRGVGAPRPDRCRVLELGCSEGVNLFSLALGLPGARFVGVDLSRRHIEDGRKDLASLGLTNVELRHASVLDVGPDWGTFDYILCHGVYSWVPPAVQDKILGLCQTNLAPDGVAYVSYNTHPGWGLTSALRDTLRFHCRPFTDPGERLRAARELIDFLTASLEIDSGPYSTLLREDLTLLQRAGDNYLLHEHLDDYNEPLPFHAFVERAAARGLGYLGETSLPTMAPGNFHPDVTEGLRRLGRDAVHVEQLMDTLRYRSFRTTLLVHAARAPTDGFSTAAVPTMHVATTLTPVSGEPDLTSNEAEKFEAPDGFVLETDEPPLKAALACLCSVKPAAAPFGELWRAVCDCLGGPPADGPDGLARNLLRGAMVKVVELHVVPPLFARGVSARPLASPLARMQARRGDRVTTLRHEPVELEPIFRALLELTDGSRDRAALLAGLVKMVEAGALSVAPPPGSDAPSDPRLLLDRVLDVALQRLAAQALLLA